MEASKTFFCANGEGAADQNNRLGCKNIDDQARLVRHRTLDFKAVLQAIETNSTSNTRRVSGKLGV